MKINYSFIILIIFCLYCGFIIELSIFIISLFLHELNHLLFVWIFKGKIKNIKFLYYGLNMSIDINELKIIPKIIIYLSGIMMNSLIIFIFKNDSLNFSASLNNIIKSIIIINQIIIIFNLLPIYPLDGYQLLKTILEECFKNDYYHNTVFKIISLCSFFTIFIVLIYSIYIESFGLLIIMIILLNKNVNKVKTRDKEILEQLFKLIT